ncbi:MAG: D-arabinono-1,4-lactone oxidase [Rhodococcus sp. (in: high G+C Gram-positive bacteria)]|uniref:D-arabinono-1,4-lactone oxidase n=1 Tax=Rhodococcus TaxID=1827 RepID=UPI001328253A|nr:D-arabinono-1,4-lactone oxidase [Rhodococcus pyridinivorans]MXQ75865.1 FAD-binding protein [Rhodococcus rhodochrous]
MATWRNWARTERATPRRFETPGSVDDLARVVVRASERGEHVKAVGAGHSFTGAAVTDGTLISLDRMSGLVAVEPSATGARVTVRAGTRLHDLSDLLWTQGLAVPNLGDIDVQSVAGAISTGTHGTGATFRGLAAAVCGATIVLADGRIVDCSPEHEPDLFEAARLGLGALGVLATVTLDCVPAFRLRAEEAPSSLRTTLTALDELRSGVDHFEFYWFPHTDGVLVKRNTRLPGEAPVQPVGRVRTLLDDELLSNGAFALFQQVGTRIPATIPALNRVASRALSPRTFVDRSYRVFASIRRVRFREMEYALPAEHLPEVLREIDAWLQRKDVRVGFPVEVRFAQGDDVWLSTAHGRDTAYVAVHQYHRRDHAAYFDGVEPILRAAQGRPHWGKLHSLTADDLRELYPRFDDFLAVRDRVDPHRTFTNPYLRRVLGE